MESSLMGETSGGHNASPDQSVAKVMPRTIT